jgi:hypothetical protein
MHKMEFENCGRSMRWHEWLTGLLLLGLIGGVRAESVYKCVDAHGAIAYQAQTCDASRQRQSVIDIAPPPPLAPAPHYVLARQDEQAARPLRGAREHAPREMAYECRVSDGRIFYRLGTCPHSLGADAGAGSKSKRGKGGGTRGAGAAVHVASRQIPREQACHEIHRAGAIGRDGHEFDERVSTYERDLGHDPCR